MAAKEAVKIAREYFSQMAEEPMERVVLDEINSDNERGTQVWRITVSRPAHHFSPVGRPNGTFGDLLLAPNRDYRVVTLSKVDGTVMSLLARPTKND